MKRIVSIFLAVALLSAAMPMTASAAGTPAEKQPLSGSDIFPYIPEAASFLQRGLRGWTENWLGRVLVPGLTTILYYLLWPGTKLVHLLRESGVLKAIVAPVIKLIYPPIKDFCPTPEPKPVFVEKHSIADYKIIYDTGASVTEINAANILADTLRQITGDSWAAIQAVPTGSKEILVGSVSGEDISQLGADGYLIKADGENIVITGGQRGVIYGVYQFLRKYFDCRWYTPEWIVIPKGEAEIALVETERFVPPLEFRDMFWHEGTNQTFSAANGLNGNFGRKMPDSLGGDFGYASNFGHTLPNQFVKVSEFYESHPEWYAQNPNSTGHLMQLCLTNPEVLAQTIHEVRELLQNSNGQPIISITQNDSYGDKPNNCLCANCKAVDDYEGSPAGTMIRFVNAIAADIAEDYPDVYIDTFAYRYTRTPPKHTKPLPNVIIRLCSIECCFAHALDDPKSAENVKFANDIKAWSQISNQLYIWDYTTNFAHYNCIFPNFGVLQNNMKFFIEYNVKGVFEQGNITSNKSNSEFAGLRAYLLARLLFNPDIDYDAEMNGFLKAYYGGGWQYMREFINLVSKTTGTIKEHKKLDIYISPMNKDLLNLKPNQITYADKLWKKAIELAGSEACKQNVLRSQLCWRFWKGCNMASEFNRWLQPMKIWQAANKQLYTDFKAFGITQYSEGPWSDTDFGWRFLQEPPADWWGTPDTWRG